MAFVQLGLHEGIRSSDINIREPESLRIKHEYYRVCSFYSLLV